jgi:hypothetical protein
MGQEDTGAPKLALDEPLPGEKLIDKLKLDGKTRRQSSPATDGRETRRLR